MNPRIPITERRRTILQETIALIQSMPWLAIGGVFVAINLILFVLRLTRRLLLLAIGVAFVAVGLYTGRLSLPTDLPDNLPDLPVHVPIDLPTDLPSKLPNLRS